MTEAHAPLGLHPRDLGDILNAGVELCRRSYRSLILAVAIPVIPVEIVSRLLQAQADDDFGLTETTDRFGAKVTHFDGGQLLGSMAATFGALALSMVATTLASAACTKVVAGAYLGEEVSWLESLRFARSRFGALVAMSLLAGLGMVLGLVLLVLPGIYLVVAWIVATPALLLEGAAPGDALRRSRWLVRGRWWSTAGVLLILVLLAGITSAVLTLGLQAPFDDGTALSTAVGIVVGVASSLIITPFAAAAYVALYVDLRVRKEGFDEHQLAVNMGVAPPDHGLGYIPPPPPPPT